MNDKRGGMNESARAIVRAMLPDAARLGVEWSVAGCGAEVVDCGIHTAGSPEAGRFYAMACLGGCGQVELGVMMVGRHRTPSVTVRVNEPVRGCMASQYAGWLIKGDEERHYFAMASGPARALYGGEALFGEIGCREASDVALLALETRIYPPDSVLEYIASSCGVKPENLMVLLAPSASVTGSVQVAARIVETGLHKLHVLGFDISCVSAGWGEAPVAPVASNDGQAIGWTNDAILYGGSAWYTVNCEDARIEEILPKLPACSSPDYGEPFFELLRRCSWDFYRIDPMLFSPAVVYVNNAQTGRTYVSGKRNEALLEEQWLVQNA